MSDITNELLLERAREVLEECSGTVMGGMLERAITDKEWELVRLYTVQAENYLRNFEISEEIV